MKLGLIATREDTGEGTYPWAADSYRRFLRTCSVVSLFEATRAECVVVPYSRAPRRTVSSFSDLPQGDVTDPTVCFGPSEERSGSRLHPLLSKSRPGQAAIGDGPA